MNSVTAKNFLQLLINRISYHFFSQLVHLELYYEVTLAEWLSERLNTRWAPNTGCKKNISIKVSAEKTIDLKLEAFIFGSLLICENKQGNHLSKLQ